MALTAGQRRALNELFYRLIDDAGYRPEVLGDLGLGDLLAVAAETHDDNLRTMPYNSPKDLWNVETTAGLAAQASVTRPAAIGIQRVAKRVSASLACDSTPQGPIVLYLRDGASGLGAVLKAWVRGAPANDYATVDEDLLDVVGTAGNALTLEWAAAGVSGSRQTVALQGYDLP